MAAPVEEVTTPIFLGMKGICFLSWENRPSLSNLFLIPQGPIQFTNTTTFISLT